MKTATKHDIEAIINWLNQTEKDNRKKHNEKLVNGDKETVWSSFHFGYAEGIAYSLELLNKIIKPVKIEIKEV